MENWYKIKFDKTAAFAEIPIVHAAKNAEQQI